LAEHLDNDAEGADGSVEEQLYDEYVAWAARGDAPQPAEFLAAHGPVSDALRRALQRIARHATRPPRDTPLPWEFLGDYRLIERIGEGGMGVVFLAEERSLGRTVALKVLRPELAGSAVAAERFRREARAVAQLRHPNIVTLFSAGEESGVRYLAMEHVPGEALADMFSNGALQATSIPQRVRWTLQIARALQCAHEQGVVHRDVKPSNIRIASSARALILDFGLARTLESDDMSLTESFAGSPKYASPEQIARSSSVDARSDVYSLGVTLYQLICGRAPFEGGSMEQLFHRILTSDPPPLRQLAPQAPRDLEVVVHKAMERDPARRYASAAEFADDLEALLELRPIRGRPPDVFERARREARRRPALSATLATGVLAAAVFSALVLLRARAERASAREHARLEIERAGAAVERYRESRSSLDALQRQVRELRAQQKARFLGDDEYALLDENEERLSVLQREWSEAYFKVLDMLQTAERLDPAVRGADEVRARLYRERWREALAQGDATGAEAYRERVRQYDAAGEFADELATKLELHLATDPPGAEVFAFRFDDLSRHIPGADARFAPLSTANDGAAPPPGTWCLRLLGDFGAARAADVIVELNGWPIEGSVLALCGEAPIEPGDRLAAFDGRAVDDVWLAETRVPTRTPIAREDSGGYADRWTFERGGERFELEAATADELGLKLGAPWEYAALNERPPVRCRAWRDGAYVEYELAAGAPVRPTARPLLARSADSIGRTPLTGVELARGNYLLAVRREGFEELRITLREDWPRYERSFELLPNGTTPPGWARITHAETAGGPPVWLAEREVSSAEYLEFLNAPSTQRELDADAQLLRAPREGGANLRVHWRRAPNGRFELPSNWGLDWPVVGVSWEDAQAFARWRNDRAREAGEPFVYSLPERAVLVAAGAGAFPWTYVYGDRFRAKFSRCCFARPNAHLGPALRFPIDESPFGVFDLTGGAFEWVEGWYDEPRRYRHALGGAWGQGDPNVLTLEGGMGAPQTSSSGETGLRLARRPLESSR
jgi:hypothetical protein